MIIRKGIKEDIPQVLDLVKELAEYENALEKLSNTVEKMVKDGFGNNPVYDLFVAENNSRVIGIAITFFRYSTWKGKVLYLEDLVIKHQDRRKWIGKKLFEEVIKFAKKENCVGLSLQVLDWNESAINFYKKYNVDFDDEWINCYLEF